MKKIADIYFTFIMPLFLTIFFYITKIVNLNSFFDCLIFYILGIIISFLGNILRNYMISWHENEN